MTIPSVTGEHLLACRCILFDFDGTLCDSMFDIKQAFYDAAVACGYDPATLNEIPVGPPLAASLRAGLGRDVEREELETLVAKYRECYNASDFTGSPFYPGAIELIERLRASGVRIALATNKSERATLRILALKEVVPLFDRILCHDSGGEFWSKERMIRTVLDETETAETDALFFGDATTDIAAGRNVGVPTVAALYGYGIAEELHAAEPDFVCPNLAELLYSLITAG